MNWTLGRGRALKFRIEEGTLHGGNSMRANIQKQEDRAYSKKMASESIWQDLSKESCTEEAG